MEPQVLQSNNERQARLFGPVILITLTAMIVLVLASAYLINRFDDTARQREQEMVSHGFAQRVQEYAAQVVPQINWDDTVAHIDNEFDGEWADQNLASYLASIGHVRRVFVLNDDNALLYAGNEGGRASLSDYAPYARASAPLAARIRAQERHRPPLRISPDGKSMISRPIQATTILVHNGQPELLIATLVQPDFGKAMPHSPRSPIVLATIPVDVAMLKPFASRYLIADMRVRERRPRAPTSAFIPLRNMEGKDTAWLSWTPRKPGSDLLGNLFTPLLAVLAVFALVVVSLMRRSAAMASDLIASEARARHLAHHDTLTQLPNRALMFDRMRQMLALARRVHSESAIHCIDLDRFKEVNDSLGHHAGDELIQQVARRLCQVCRDSDTVARLGGDEFVIIQPGANGPGASHLARRILEAIKEPFELEQGVVEIGCSIGTTVVSNPDLEPAELLRQADLALYRSKENGRAQVTFFEVEMDAALKMRRSLETDLRRALADGALSMVYQPQMDQRGTITGIEALVRWTHPEKGAIPPSVFVPLAEESGLILDLGEFVFRRVFAETHSWRKLRTAINVSAVQLRSSGFAPLVRRLVDEYRIDPENYEIEITETALLGDDSVTIDNIGFLKTCGFSIALDDFGTGYSSLSCLQRFAVDKIKIDRSFVNNLNASEESEALVDAIVKLGRALKLNIIAEGVETEEQRERLAQCGCSDIQGFLVSRPVSADAIADMTRAGRIATGR